MAGEKSGYMHGFGLTVAVDMNKLAVLIKLTHSNELEKPK